MSLSERLRQLPSVEETARRLEPLARDIPRALLVKEIRAAIEAERERILNGAEPTGDLEAQVLKALERIRRSSLRRVINATGVVLHTNLGRAPLPAFVPHLGYTNLEYDLAAGARGKRDAHVAGLLERLLGKPAIAVNNNAAAVFLVLNELAAGGEAIVSRGQLIEIGDGFRIPEIIARAGVTLREVGTTNRTRIDDYREAIGERTRLLLLVHPSNFRIEGFTAQPERGEIVALGRACGIPVFEDLGSGCLVDLSPYGIREPLAQESLADGVSLVSFSADKLLGGPQAGIIAGDPQLVQRLRRNPLFRALRLDKLILQALETALRLLLLERYDAIPALRMIRTSAEEIRRRALRLIEQLPGLPATLEPGDSLIGGGSTPQQSLPTWRIALAAPDPASWERRLRAAEPPVIALVQNDRLLLDLRTVREEEEQELVRVLAETAAQRAPGGATAAAPRT